MKGDNLNYHVSLNVQKEIDERGKVERLKQE